MPDLVAIQALTLEWAGNNINRFIYYIITKRVTIFYCD